MFRILLTLLSIVMVAPATKASEVPDTLEGVGVLMFDPAFRKKVNLTVYNAKDSRSAVLGRIKVKDEPRPTWTSLVKTWQEENPDAGWFGDKVITRREEKPFREYVSTKGRVGFFVYEEDPVWMRVEHGWVLRADIKRNNLLYLTWQEAMDNKRTPELRVNIDRNLPKNMRLDDARQYANHSPIGIVKVFNGTGEGATDIISARTPLRFVMLDQKDDWYEVLVVLNECDVSDGQSDYREGTLGWIKTVSDEGKPHLFRHQKPCE